MGSRPRPSSRPSPRRPSRTSSVGLQVCGEPREEAPRVLLHFLLLLLVHPPPSEEHSCHFVQVGRRVRGHAWPSPVPGRSARAITCTPRLSRRSKKNKKKKKKKKKKKVPRVFPPP